MAQGNQHERAWSRALNRLKSFCNRSLRAAVGEDSFQQLTDREVAAAVADVKTLAVSRDGEKSSVWVSMHPESMAGLLALYGRALRSSCSSLQPGVPESLRIAYTALRVELAHQLSNARHLLDDSSSGSHKLDTGLLRTHVPRCYAHLLRGAADMMAQGNTTQLKALLLETGHVLSYMCSVLAWLREEGSLPHPSVELRSSGLMEQWARGVLLLAATEGGSDGAAAVLDMVLLKVNCCCWKDTALLLASSPSLSYLLSSHLVGLCAALDGGTTYGMPSGPGAAVALPSEGAGLSLQPPTTPPVCLMPQQVQVHLAKWALEMWGQSIADASSLLCQARSDLGNDAVGQCQRVCMRGSPLSLRRALRACLCHLQQRAAEPRSGEAGQGSAASQDRGQQQQQPTAAADADVCEERAQKIRQIVAGPPLPPLNTTTAFNVAFRVGVCCVKALEQAGLASAAASDAASDVRRQAELQGHLQAASVPYLRASDALLLGTEAFACAHAACEEAARLPRSRAPEEAMTQLRTLWRTQLAFVAACLAVKEGDDGHGVTGSSIGRALALGNFRNADDQSQASPPAELPAGVAVALEAGYLPALERGLRIASKETGALTQLIGLGGCTWTLALGSSPPRQAAALAATVAKVLLRECNSMVEAAVKAAAAGRLGVAASCGNREERDQELGQECLHVCLALGAVKGLLPVHSDGRLWPQRAAADAEAAASAAGNVEQPSGQRGASCSVGSAGDYGVADAATTAINGTGTDVMPGVSVSSIPVRDVTGAGCRAAPAAARPAEPNASRQENFARSSSIGQTSEEGFDAGESSHGTCSSGGGRDNAYAGADAALHALARGASISALHLMPAVSLVLRRMYASGLHTEMKALYHSWGLAKQLSAVPVFAAAAAGYSSASHRTDNGSYSCPEAARCPHHEKAAAAEEWRRFLRRDLQLPWLLATAAELISSGSDDPRNQLQAALSACLRALACLLPGELASMLTAEGQVEAGEAAKAQTASTSVVAPSLSQLRALLGPGGAMADPELLAAVEAACGGGGGRPSTEANALPPDVLHWEAAAALLMSPSAVRAALPVCSNPLCTNLEGDSEAALRLRGCAGCGEVARYCSRSCQVAHWRAAHSKECAGKGAAAAATAPGTTAPLEVKESKRPNEVALAAEEEAVVREKAPETEQAVSRAVIASAEAEAGAVGGAATVAEPSTVSHAASAQAEAVATSGSASAPEGAVGKHMARAEEEAAIATGGSALAAEPIAGNQTASAEAEGAAADGGSVSVAEATTGNKGASAVAGGAAVSVAEATAGNQTTSAEAAVAVGGSASVMQATAGDQMAPAAKEATGGDSTAMTEATAGYQTASTEAEAAAASGSAPVAKATAGDHAAPRCTEADANGRLGTVVKPNNAAAANAAVVVAIEVFADGDAEAAGIIGGQAAKVKEAKGGIVTATKAAAGSGTAATAPTARYAAGRLAVAALRPEASAACYAPPQAAVDTGGASVAAGAAADAEGIAPSACESALGPAAAAPFAATEARVPTLSDTKSPCNMPAASARIDCGFVPSSSPGAFELPSPLLDAAGRTLALVVPPAANGVGLMCILAGLAVEAALATAVADATAVVGAGREQEAPPTHGLIA